MIYASTNPLVSILINNYNYGHFLADAIDSALAQTYPHIEVIVVDDGSTDNSQDVIARYEPKIIPVLKANGGQASAFNAGFAACKGDIICLLDADDTFLPMKVTEVVRHLNNDDQYRQLYWCFHLLQFRDAQLKTLVKSHFDAQGTGLVHKCDLRREMREGGIRQKLPFSIPPTSGLSFTRSLLQQILPMPEARGITLNDSYLQFTALALGEGYAIAQKLALQRVHADNAHTKTHITQKAQRLATIHCLTAYWININYPFLNKFSDKIFSLGLSAYWRSGSKEIAGTVHQYLDSRPGWQKAKILIRALYHCILSRQLV